MKIAKHLLEGVKLLALFGAVALVVWSMPERGVEYAHQSAGQFSISSH